MKIYELGEREVLERVIFPLLDKNINELDIDEDAVAIKLDDSHFLVINTDTFVKKTDAPALMEYRQMGIRVVTMSVSDLFAKGALPKGFLLAASVPAYLDLDSFREIILGIKDACKKYNMSFLGGDLGGADDVVLTGIAFGFSERIIRRDSARPSDTVWVTGDFGISGAALHYMLNKGKAEEHIISCILDKYFNPQISLSDAKGLIRCASAAMDSSDGLAITLHTLARKSKVKIVLDKIPLNSVVIEYAKLNKADPIKFALYGGEEFEIVFTVRNMNDNEVIKIFKKHGARKPIKIGKIEKGEGVFYGNKRIEERGWQHFTK